MAKDQTLEQLLADDSFVKWITGRASGEQSDYWKAWEAKDPDHAHLVGQAKKLIQFTSPDSHTIPDLRTELEKLESSYHQNGFSQKNITLSNYKKRQLHSNRFIGAIAAGLLILIVSFSAFYIYNKRYTKKEVPQAATIQSREFRTGNGEKLSLKLSDGSLIILNENSHFKYLSTERQGQNIDVWLEGEAYFKVTHLKEENRRLFTVHTKDGSVKVLGTTFAVETLPSGTRAVLKKGEIKVEVKTKEGSGISKKIFILEPGQLAKFQYGETNVTLKKVNPLVYTSWIKGKWVFENAPLPKVARRIEEEFGVEVVIASDALQSRRLSGSIKSTSLEILKEALSEALQVPVRQNDGTIMIGLEK